MPTIDKRTAERRRSQRIPLAAPINISGLDSLLFGGRCNTVDVSLHGCQFFITRPMRHGERLRIHVADTDCTVTARVVRSMPAVLDMKVKLWKISVEFESPCNVWGVESAPPDWTL